MISMLNLKIELTQCYVKKRVHYEPLTGLVTWNRKTVLCNHDKLWNAKHEGKEVGTKRAVSGVGKSYHIVKLDGKTYQVHKLVWLYMEGHYPDMLDHEDGNGLNNKWSNLRLASYELNSKNKRRYSSNKSGISGVSQRGAKWLVRISHKGVRQHLGEFEDLFEACCVRKAAEVRLGFHKDHGANRPLY
jgi:hypothetical protein